MYPILMIVLCAIFALAIKYTQGFESKKTETLTLIDFGINTFTYISIFIFYSNIGRLTQMLGTRVDIKLVYMDQLSIFSFIFFSLSLLLVILSGFFNNDQASHLTFTIGWTNMSSFFGNLIASRFQPFTFPLLIITAVVLVIRNVPQPKDLQKMKWGIYTNVFIFAYFFLISFIYLKIY